MSQSVTKMLTPYERCERDGVGQRCLKDAIDAKAKRKEWADKECGQAAKDVAGYIAGQARGRITVCTIKADDWERIFGKKGKQHAM